MKKFSSITRVNSRRTSQTKKNVGLFVIVGVVVLIALWLLPKLLAGAAAVVVTPIQAAQTWLFESTGNLPLYLRDRQVLILENQKLHEELALQSGQEYSVQLLRRENQELRSLLGDEGKTRIMAGIIGRPNALPYDVLVIDQGARDGVVENAPVYIGDNRVVGVVKKVFSDSAVVEMVTTPGFVTSVFVVGPNIYTNATGIGGGQLRVGVPQGIALAIGDSVILPAVDSGVLGVISHIESLPTQPEQYGYVATDVPLQSLRFVAVGSAPVESVTFEQAQAIVAEGLSRLFTVPVPEGVLVVTGTTSTSTATSSAASTTPLE